MAENRFRIYAFLFFCVFRGSGMRSIKIFSNNAVSVVMPNGREAIVLGNGIGFHKRPGNEIDERKIQKVYYVQDEMQLKFLNMLQDVRPEVMEAAEQIIARAEANGCSMSSQAMISLIDHISFAIERQSSGLALPNLLLSETRLLYSREYELGCQALEIIRECCGAELPLDEAGYIALHIISISVDRNAAYDILKFVKGALDIIKQTYGVVLDEESIDTMRLITHLKFLAQRIFQKSGWEDDGMEDMYEMLLDRHPKNRLCLERLDQYCQATFSYTLNLQEKFYLLIHLTKIL